MDLIEVWGQAPNVHDLRTRRRNAAVYGRIAAAMATRGHRRTQEQVRIKIKKLRQAYARATRGGATAGAATCPYFTALHQVLGGRAVRASPGDIEPGPEGPDLGTPEGSPPAASSRETVPAAPAARAGRTTPPGTCSRTRGLLRTASTEQEYRDQHLGALQAVHHTLRSWMQEDLQVRHELLAELRGLSTNLQLLLQRLVPRADPAPAVPPTVVPPPTPAPPPTSPSSTPTTSSSITSPLGDEMVFNEGQEQLKLKLRTNHRNPELSSAPEMLCYQHHSYLQETTVFLRILESISNLLENTKAILDDDTATPGG
ncbi:uncharacterized protein LOC142830266 [Pelodiscus sinensis]|uniref:uncharacterized protein LOC142830266 n=1 Tax=Pelodiscus sinensis TaxID=13735 RepID=UPI003F6B767E